MFDYLYNLVVNNKEFIGALIPIGTILYAIYKITQKKVITPIKVRINQFEQIINKVDKISSTLGPNGGSSIYDKICSMDHKLSINDSRSETLNSVIDIGEWQSDENGLTTSINDVICRMVGRPETDFLGQNWINIIHPDDRHLVTVEWFDCVKNNRTFKMEYRWLDNEGHSVPILAVGKPIFDSSNKLKGWIGSVYKKRPQT